MGWTKQKDARLLRMLAEGKSHREIAKALGTTRNATIGRAGRLSHLRAGTKFAYLIAASKEVLARRAIRREMEQGRVGRLRRLIRRGLTRHQAIEMGRDMGLPFRAIADIYGVSPQCIQQQASAS